jgi:hypothetical protein
MEMGFLGRWRNRAGSFEGNLHFPAIGVRSQILEGFAALSRPKTTLSPW